MVFDDEMVAEDMDDFSADFISSKPAAAVPASVASNGPRAGRRALGRGPSFGGGGGLGDPGVGSTFNSVGGGDQGDAGLGGHLGGGLGAGNDGGSAYRPSGLGGGLGGADASSASSYQPSGLGGGEGYQPTLGAGPRRGRRSFLLGGPTAGAAAGGGDAAGIFKPVQPDPAPTSVIGAPEQSEPQGEVLGSGGGGGYQPSGMGGEAGGSGGVFGGNAGLGGGAPAPRMGRRATASLLGGPPGGGMQQLDPPAAGGAGADAHAAAPAPAQRSPSPGQQTAAPPARESPQAAQPPAPAAALVPERQSQPDIGWNKGSKPAKPGGFKFKFGGAGAKQPEPASPPKAAAPETAVSQGPGPAGLTPLPAREPARRHLAPEEPAGAGDAGPGGEPRAGGARGRKAADARAAGAKLSEDRVHKSERLRKLEAELADLAVRPGPLAPDCLRTSACVPHSAGRPGR
jgi:hypothetical protein